MKIQNPKSKIQKFISLVICHWLLVIFLSGCATVPVRETLPTYNIHGTNYVSLISLCDSRDVVWEYDTFTRRINLSLGLHRINLMVGDKLVLVDGKPKDIRHPVDIYQGSIVVPFKFKREIFDSLFKKFPPFSKTVLPAVKIKKIVIDAGHGGTDPGAIGKAGLKEKDATLDITKRLSRLLSGSGIKVVMTRSTDKFIPLSSRANIANNSQADLFISIHANANRVRRLNGFEIYYVSPKAGDSERAMNAAKNVSLDIDRSYFASQSLDLKATLWDMIYTYKRAESIELARAICHSVDRNLNTKVIGVKSANFYVLRGVRIPAVLIEVGFLSNYKEERLLKNSYYRQQIAEAIAQGIENYARAALLMEVSRR